VSHEIRKTYVELLYPGVFLPEESVVEVNERDPEAIAAKYPNAFCFKFFDLIETEVIVGGQKKRVTTSRLNESKRYYPNAKLLSQADVKRLGPEYRTLLSNMECNEWPTVVQCNRGNFQPFESGDTILEQDAALRKGR
jgi:hypothetical protein